MNEIRGFDIIFPREYLRAALVVSLLSVWVLVGLFYYLNRYTKRHYFTIWTASWLFYALWLTLGMTVGNLAPGSMVFSLRQLCVSISAVFLMWGSLSFMERPAPQRLFGTFIIFLVAWTCAGNLFVKDAFYVQVATFTFIGLASMFSGLSFYRLRQRRQFVAVGMLFLGFFLWGVYLISYPFSQKYETLINAGFLFSAVLQLFIAVSMIVLVLEEARHINERVLQDVQAVNAEKRELQLKILSTEEQCRSLFQRAHSREELQSAYDELRQTQQSVMQQERLRALGQMASGIAHDINNALSPVLAFSELVLKKEPNLSDNSRKNLEHVRTAAEDIAQIVKRMSEFYRRRKNKDELRPFPINHLVQQVVDMTSPCWRDIPQGRGIAVQVVTRFEDALPELYGNESELREALTNVVLNAVDALPEGGLITISTRAVALAGPPSQPPKPTHIVLEVADNGVGMDDSTRQRCLEPFFSTKRQRGGSGLGLAMVYGAVERHEGHIEIQSALHKGTTVRLLLPLREGPKALGPGVPAAAGESSRLRVLCIDDEPLLRELLKEMLEFYHHEVVTADGGQPGLDLFDRALASGQPFDVVITDLGMPGVNGRQVVEKIKADSPRTPVIMLTGWGNMLEERSAQEPQADAVLTKPPRVAEMVEALAKVTGCGVTRETSFFQRYNVRPRAAAPADGSAKA
ncbi:MAG TPA: ATP-binding protein [Candidatus Binatia bacterium]|jgi:signal transduction histidine kinase/FixJ family two-component response regulator|nr:ATP-binding protein [Candidatus Binatia bacterium]